MKLDKFETTVELQDLGNIRSEWAGILSPMYNDEIVHKYIHSQFLEEAEHYIERYQSLDYWTGLLRLAQEHMVGKGPEKILDIGSGAGNTIFGLFELYPTASIIASDLSLPLLKGLKDFYLQKYANRSCIIMQLNAEELIFQEHQFDLVVGGAILHHLLSPEKTLAQSAKVLKAGGHAVFFEPFEIGNQLIALILKHLLQVNSSLSRFDRKRRMAPKIVRFFERLCKDFEVRKGIDKSGEIFQRIDDKWLFTRSYFEDQAQATGFQRVHVYPLHGTVNQFSSQIQTYLRLGLQTDYKALPEWAREYISKMDQHFTPEVRRELLIEGCVIFDK